MIRDLPPPLRVLVLGGSGHIGRRWLALQHTHRVGAQSVEALCASRRGGAGGEGAAALRLDVRNAAALRQALRGMDAVVNAVAGSSDTIATGTAQLCEAALHHNVRVVHLSTQSVYGLFEGVVHESMPIDPRLGWYGRAKCMAEMHVREFVRRGGQAVVLRPGCVWGPGSALWVGRIAGWLRSGRLGELGARGDGWSNLVHVDDVCLAISRALQLPLASGELPTFNIAAPDSPRWNDCFVDLALALGAIPVPRLRAGQLWVDSHIVSPPLKAAALLARRLGLPTEGFPAPMPPGLVRLWGQHLRLDAGAATRRLQLPWTPYAKALADSVRWVRNASATDRSVAETP